MDANTLGRSVRRLEDFRFLTGHGRYVDDIAVPGAAQLHVLRSPHAHAAIERIDIAAARAAPGVLGVFAEADLRRGSGSAPLRGAGHRRGTADRAAALCAGAWAGAACRRSGGVRGRRDAGAGARCGGADRGRIPPAACGGRRAGGACRPERLRSGTRRRAISLSRSARRRRSGRCRRRRAAQVAEIVLVNNRLARHRSSRGRRSRATTPRPAASICC